MAYPSNMGKKNNCYYITVGSSLFSSQNRNSTIYLEKLNNLKNNALAGLSNTSVFRSPTSEQLEYEDALLIALLKTQNQHRLSAELGTLLLSENPVNDSDKVQMIAIDTVDSIIAARVIAKYLEKQCLCKVDTCLIHGLQIDNLSRLESQGFPNLIKHIILEKNTMDKNRQMVLVVTGGYKPVSNYLTVIGLVLGVPVLYHFEKGIPLFLPSVKLKPDNETWIENIRLFSLFERKGTYELEEIQEYLIDLSNPAIKPYLYEENGQLSLTAFGNILVHSCKETYMDGLTGTWTKDFYEKIAFRFCVGEKKAAVVMFDLDHFKLINDNYGHHAGDQVLSEIGMRTVKHVNKWKSPAPIIRYGGEEFLVILPGADPEDAARYFEKFRKEVEVKQVETDSGLIKVTVSIGVSACNFLPGDDIKMSLTEALKRADMALYRAKNSGRNKVLIDGVN